MQKILFSVIAALALVVAAPSLIDSTAQAEKKDKAKKAEADIPEVSVDELAKQLKKKECVPVDANNPTTREKYGSIPGSKKLSSSSRFKPTEELPKDKATNLVFYCSNTNCRASDGAAVRAQEAGYKNVKILRAGVKGWVDAGHKTDKAKAKK